MVANDDSVIVYPKCFFERSYFLKTLKTTAQFNLIAKITEVMNLKHVFKTICTFLAIGVTLFLWIRFG